MGDGSGGLVGLVDTGVLVDGGDLAPADPVAFKLNPNAKFR